jgi:hypothetical protein
MSLPTASVKITLASGVERTPFQGLAYTSTV